jgi:hypothetical protein
MMLLLDLDPHDEHVCVGEQHWRKHGNRCYGRTALADLYVADPVVSQRIQPLLHPTIIITTANLARDVG